jgi:thymidine kinase
MRKPEFIHTYGVMGSGKTLMAIQRAMTLDRRKYAYAITKSSVDTKAGQAIQTRFGEVSRPVDFVTHPDDNLVELTLNALARKQRGLGVSAQNLALVIDEVNFMSREQVFQAEALVDQHGVSVYTFGIGTDFLGRQFEGAAYARALADRSIELSADCYGLHDDGECSNDATYNARLVNDVYTFSGEQVAIDEESALRPVQESVTTYRSLCHVCYNLARAEALAAGNQS